MPDPTTMRRQPAAPAPTTAAHQLERILYILPAAAQEGGAALDELASRLGVSPDTVWTDITDVTARAYYHPADSGSELQIELTGDRVAVWTTGEFQRPVSLSMPEAVCLGLAQRGTPEAETSAALTHLESTLAGASTPELLQTMEATELTPGPTGIRDTVTGALQEKTALRIRYLKPGDPEPLERTVHPYALAHGEGCWYLLAWCEVSEEVRIFRVDRILGAASTGAPFQVPAEFDAEAYIQGGRVYRGGQETEVRVRYSPKIARWIAERECGEWDEEKGFTVTHRVADPHWIVRHVLQYGGEAEVLEPEEVRGWVREAVRAT